MCMPRCLYLACFHLILLVLHQRFQCDMLNLLLFCNYLVFSKILIYSYLYLFLLNFLIKGPFALYNNLQLLKMNKINYLLQNILDFVY